MFGVFGWSSIAASSERPNRISPAAPAYTTRYHLTARGVACLGGWITPPRTGLAPAAKSDRQACYASARLDHTAHRARYLRRRLDLTARRNMLMHGWITLLSAALAPAAKSDRQACYASARLDHTTHCDTCVMPLRVWITPPTAVLMSAARYACQAHRAYARLNHTAQHDLTARRITLMRSWITLPSMALALAGTSEDFHLYAWFSVNVNGLLYPVPIFSFMNLFSTSA
ncbi:hypothetical protein DFH08DRAFT_797567 [Mycena albidolilacea]|uniref:Uncharacterized protein n=1 Tax=Mycena albidolilacea TaxID=1033008 RepID=A0AAD7F4N7_9AGAR|nr:hypothetical protein DFH08DRAFT_797567 [Mycena albidolilacea]